MPRFLPRILKAARNAADLARNWRLVWAGALADNRTLKGEQGEYRVQVLPPLRVTDDGIAVDLKDERWALIPTTAAPGLPAGGLTGNVLRKASDTDGDVEWFDGPSQQVQVVTDFRYDIQSHCLQKQTVCLTLLGGLIVEVSQASEWTTVDGGEAAPCETA